MPTMSEEPRIVVAVKSFLGSCPQQLEFPLGGNVSIPREVELALLEVIGRAMPVPESDLHTLRSEVTFDQSYDLVIFAVRMAVLSARTAQPKPLTLGLLGLVIDENEVDSR